MCAALLGGPGVVSVDWIEKAAETSDSVESRGYTNLPKVVNHLSVSLLVYGVSGRQPALNSTSTRRSNTGHHQLPRPLLHVSSVAFPRLLHSASLKIPPHPLPYLRYGVSCPSRPCSLSRVRSGR